MQLRQRTKFVVVDTDLDTKLQDPDDTTCFAYKHTTTDKTKPSYFDYLCSVDPSTIYSTRKLVQYVCQLQGCVHALEAHQHALSSIR